MIRLVFLLSCVGMLCASATAQVAGCNNDSNCIGNALVLNGSNQYVDVPLTPSFNNVDSIGALTVETWLYIVPHPGSVQIIAGKWGPRRDRDDEWLFFVDDKDTLRFRVSNGGSNVGDVDNTDARIYFTPLYNQWVHVAGVWDSTTHSVRMYVNGALADSGTNDLYPPRSLRRTNAYMQLGSFNGFANAAANYRTLDGQLDEFRVWSEVRTPTELACGRYHYFLGNEPQLIAYYPCDGGLDPTVLCDLTANANDGGLRNGAQTILSTRTIPQFVTTNITDTLRLNLFCETDTTFSFTLTDTSLCGSTVNIGGAGTITMTPAIVNLPSRVPQTVTGTLHFTGIGLIDTQIVVQPQGSCSPPLVFPVTIQRATPLTLSLGRITFDTVRECQGQLELDSTITLCNTSTVPITITGITKNIPEFDTLLLGWSFPLTLAPGQCEKILIRFHGLVDSTYHDVLRILSADTCAGSGSVQLAGTVKQALRLVDSVDFGDIYQCADTAAQGYVVKMFNGAPTVENVQSVTGSTGMFVANTALPIQIPFKQERDLFIQLKYNSPGVFQDSLVITSVAGGCTVVKKLFVKGRVIAIDFTVNPTLLNFGNQIVGTSSTQTSILKNLGITQRGAYAFLKIGKVFHINPPTNFLLNPGQSATVSVTFSPTDTLNYSDTLCIQDTTCYKIIYIPLNGRGIAGPVELSPGLLNFGVVPNCLCQPETVMVTNTKATALTMKSAVLNGPGFSFVTPVGANDVIAAGQTKSYIINYCPAALTDGAYTGTITFTSDDPTTPVLIVPMNAVRVSTHFTSPAFTDFGTVEINTTQTLIIKIQNGSNYAVCIDSITAPPGFQIISAVPAPPDTFGITRILSLTVSFTPTLQAPYAGMIKIYNSCPCMEIESTQVIGVGAVIGVSFPWSTIVFSQATVCDTVYRRVAIENPSHKQITIDSIYISGPSAPAFSWRSVNLSSALPLVLPALTNDTIELAFKPGLSPLVITNAVLTVVATNAAAVQTFNVTLGGSRKSQFDMSDDSVDFGTVAVRSNAASQIVTLKNNTPADTVIIDSIWVMPDVGVFTLTAPPLNAQRVMLLPGDSINVTVDFVPKAAVKYLAKIGVRVVSPCPEIDSTIHLYGGGFTPVVLIDVCFDSVAAAQIGNQFGVGVYVSRIVPQTPVDLNLIVDYDVHAVRLQQILAPLCASSSIAYTNTGAIVSLRTCNNVDSGSLCRLMMLALVPDSVNATIAIDSIAFLADTAQVLALIGQGCGTPVSISGHCNITSLVVTSLVASMAQSVPNPAIQSAHVEYTTMENATVRLRVFDMLGREVLRPVDNFQTHGDHAVDIDVRTLPQGMYSYMIEAGVFRASRLMQVMR